MLHAIDLWHAKQFRYLMDNLSRYKDLQGSVLDNSALVWLNELSDGKSHHYRDLPFVIAGSAGGYLKQGQFMNLSKVGRPAVAGPQGPHGSSAAQQAVDHPVQRHGCQGGNGGTGYEVWHVWGGGGVRGD